MYACCGYGCVPPRSPTSQPSGSSREPIGGDRKVGGRRHPPPKSFCRSNLLTDLDPWSRGQTSPTQAKLLGSSNPSIGFSAACRPDSSVQYIKIAQPACQRARFAQYDEARVRHEVMHLSTWLDLPRFPWLPRLNLARGKDVWVFQLRAG
jgi:hypothetical protein